MADIHPHLAQLNEPLDEVLDDLEDKRVRPSAAVAAWIEHALADRLGIEVKGLSKEDREYLKDDLLEVFLAGAIADKLGWTIVDDAPPR